MRQLRAAAVLMLVWAWPAVAAEKLPPLDADFLEFLATFGGEEEDWTLVGDDEGEKAQEKDQGPPPAKEPVAKGDGSKKEAAAKPAEQR